MRNTSVRLAALGVTTALLVGGMSIAPTWSYFTDTHETEGKIRVTFDPTTDIIEDWDEKGKHVKIMNTCDEDDLYVRARAYVNANDFEDSKYYIGNVEAKKDLNNNTQLPPSTEPHWFDGGDGWWYYTGSIKPGEKTEELSVLFQFKTKETVTVQYTDNPDDKETFNVIDHTGENPNVVVSYEATPVIQEGVNPMTLDWNLVDKI